MSMCKGLGHGSKSCQGADCVQIPENTDQGRIHVWSESAPPPPPFDRQIMQIQPILGYFWAIFGLYQPPPPSFGSRLPLFTFPGSAPADGQNYEPP